MIFQKNKNSHITYLIKENNMTLDMDLKTIDIIIKDKIIKIKYLITDSNNEYEYYVEMSD